MSGLPLPARILIPVANPATAEELIRLGADLLEPRSGEITALGIVEVAEGVPLSEGATRARHARRLLQKVLSFGPPGTSIRPIVRIGRRASEGIVENRRMSTDQAEERVERQAREFELLKPYLLERWPAVPA